MTDVIDGNAPDGSDVIDGDIDTGYDIIDGNDAPAVAAPILVGNPSLPSPVADTRQVSFESMDGSIVIPFNIDTEEILIGGVTGLQMAPRTVVTGTTPGMPGSWLQEVDILQREVVMPFDIASETNQADFFARLGRLRSLIGQNWDLIDIGDLGTFRLVFTSSEGERILNVVYSDGLEGDWGAGNSGVQFEKFDLTLIAVDPFFRDRNPTQLVYSATPGEVFLSTAGTSNPWPRQLAPSVVIGEDMPIQVAGDVPVWPTLILNGPASAGTTVQAPGSAIDIPGGISDGSVLTLVTDPRARAADLDGDIAWSAVDLASTFAPLRPGINNISVILGTTSADTSLVLEYTPGYDSAY